MPVNKELIISEFLKSLKVAISDALLYSKSHPFFIRHINELKQKIQSAFEQTNSLKIFVTPDALMLDGKPLPKTSWNEELAKLLHRRKIKSIEFKNDIKIDDLIMLIDTISMPLSEILKPGGVDKIFKMSSVSHSFALERLDYSSLLADYDGQDYGDIWVYLIQEALDKNDDKSIKEYANNFDSIVSKFKIKELAGDTKLQKSVQAFLIYLKKNCKEEYVACTKKIVAAVMKSREDLTDEQYSSIRTFFSELNNDDYANILWNKLSVDNDFNAFGIKVFSQLIGKDREKPVVSAVLDKSKDTRHDQERSRISEKVEKMLSSSDNIYIPEVYRNMLSSLSGNVSVEKKYVFNRGLFGHNYRFILINMAAHEEKTENLSFILDKLLIEIESVIGIRDIQYIKHILSLCDQKTASNPSFEQIFRKIYTRVGSFIENSIFQDSPPEDVLELADNLKKSSLGREFYLKSIFTDKKINQRAVKMFFRFFPEHEDLFYDMLKQGMADMEFSMNFMEALKGIDSPWSLEALKKLYSFSNDYLKIEVLRAMQECSNFDKEFIFSILLQENITLKKEALFVLFREEGLVEEALKLLFDMPSSWGRNNRIIINHIMIIEELGIKEAQEYLKSFAKRRFFWNRQLRIKAKEALGRLNVE